MAASTPTASSATSLVLSTERGNITLVLRRDAAPVSELTLGSHESYGSGAESFTNQTHTSILPHC